MSIAAEVLERHLRRIENDTSTFATSTIEARTAASRYRIAHAGHVEKSDRLDAAKVMIGTFSKLSRATAERIARIKERLSATKRGVDTWRERLGGANRNRIRQGA